MLSDFNDRHGEMAERPKAIDSKSIFLTKSGT